MHSRGLAIGIGCAILVASPAWSQPVTWAQPHADFQGRNALDVVTAPATIPLVVKTDLGVIAPGVGPVIARQGGDAIIGNTTGRVFSIDPSGATVWTVDLPRQRVLASATTSFDGQVSNIYVVGSGLPATDHRNGTPPHKIYPLWLNKIDVTGHLVWTVPMPDRTPRGVDVGGGLSTAPPLAGRSGNLDIVFVSVVAPGSPNEVYLEAFGPSGAVLGVQQVGVYVGPTPDLMRYTEPGPTYVGVENYILATDGGHEIAGFSFDSAAGFHEVSRDRTNTRAVTSGAATRRPDGRGVFGRGNFISFSPTADGAIADINHTEQPGGSGNAVVSPPAVAPSGRIAVLGSARGVTFVDNVTPVGHVATDGASIGSAAVSHNLVYVSALNAFTTIDLETMKPLARYPWTGGGGSTPAIAATGEVYAVAANKLYIFPSPDQVAGCSVHHKGAACFKDSPALTTTTSARRSPDRPNSN